MGATYQPTDRRPIASREKKIWQRLAHLLATRNISPNAISIGGMFVGVGAGITLYFTGQLDGPWRRILWLVAAAGIQLRLLANMLDGMVAIESERASAVGELYNELPDRVSDIAIIVGCGYAAYSSPVLGYVAACVAVLTAYVRAVGKCAGAANLFDGPMAKPHRMFTLTILCALMFALPVKCLPVWCERHFGLPAVALSIIILGGGITIYRRVALTVQHLRRRH